jgi:hypothetical protein
MTRKHNITETGYFFRLQVRGGRYRFLCVLYRDFTSFTVIYNAGRWSKSTNPMILSTIILLQLSNIKETPWLESASELYRPNDQRFSAKLVPTFEDRGCHVVSVTDPYGRIFGFLDRSSYFFFQVVPQLYSRGWVESVPDPPLLGKSGSAGNRTRTSGPVARNSDH